MFISVIIPTYNSRNYLEKSLTSIFSQQPADIEVIVIDNGSKDGTEVFVRKRFPDAQLIKNKYNFGASIARNQGIDRATGEFVMFMDADTELTNGFFPKLTPLLRSLDKYTGGVSPKIIDKKTSKIFSCGLMMSPIYRVHDVGRNSSPGAFTKELPIDGPNTCCAIYRKECLEKIKEASYFDEDFFFLFEDVDLALRMKRNVCHSVFIPDLVCYHYGRSADISAQKRRYLCFRNRLYIVIKNNKSRMLLEFFIKSIWYDSVRTIHLFLTNRYSYRILGDLIRKWKKL